MRITIEKLYSQERRIAIVENGEDSPAVFALSEIAQTISWCQGMMQSGILSKRQRQMLDIAQRLIEELDKGDGPLDHAELTIGEQEPPDDEPQDDRWDPDEIIREHPLISHNPDPLSGPPF